MINISCLHQYSNFQLLCFNLELVKNLTPLLIKIVYVSFEWFSLKFESAFLINWNNFFHAFLTHIKNLSIQIFFFFIFILLFDIKRHFITWINQSDPIILDVKFLGDLHGWIPLQSCYIGHLMTWVIIIPLQLNFSITKSYNRLETAGTFFFAEYF